RTEETCPIATAQAHKTNHGRITVGVSRRMVPPRSALHRRRRPNSDQDTGSDRGRARRESASILAILTCATRRARILAGSTPAWQSGSGRPLPTRREALRMHPPPRTGERPLTLTSGESHHGRERLERRGGGHGPVCRREPPSCAPWRPTGAPV